MKIIFNLLGCGLGNNGGVRTVLKSQQTLNELGHDCKVAAKVDNFTWFKHSPVVSSVPEDADAVVAASCVDAGRTANLPFGKKLWWIRAHETWSMSNALLEKIYLNPRLKNLVNSEWQYDNLRRIGADARIVYQGIDFEDWVDLKLRNQKNKTVIGCLYSRKPRKRWSDFLLLAETLGTANFEYMAYGTEKPPQGCDYIKYYRNPTLDELQILYSSCHIWFAPTNSEGLHNCPMEAALSGCAILCSDHPRNGMIDYARPGETAMVYSDIKEAIDMAKGYDYTLVGPMQELLHEKIGDRQKNMKYMVEIIEGM